MPKHATQKKSIRRIPNAHVIAVVIDAAAVLFFTSCERKNPATTGSEVTMQPPSAASRSSAPEASIEMVKLPGGRFLMGDPNEIDAPPHEVAVSSFYIDKYLVTQEQYQKTMNANPSRWKGGKNPVEQIRWSDAVRFCNARSQSKGLSPCYDLTSWKCNFEADGYRLPTEAEWEYACRAGTTTAWFFGDDASKIGDYAWFDKNSGGHPRPVGEKRPNAWGLLDICGNVWEWCNDFYGVDYYRSSAQQDPRGPDGGKNRVLRGGAWRFSPESLRSGYRYNENPGYADVCFGYDIYGFRCVRKATDRP